MFEAYPTDPCQVDLADLDPQAHPQEAAALAALQLALDRLSAGKVEGAVRALACAAHLTLACVVVERGGTVFMRGS